MPRRAREGMPGRPIAHVAVRSDNVGRKGLDPEQRERFTRWVEQGRARAFMSQVVNREKPGISLFEIYDRSRIPIGFRTAQQHVKARTTKLSMQPAWFSANGNRRIWESIAGSRAGFEWWLSLGDDWTRRVSNAKLRNNPERA